jgi:hypothetical protein
MVVLTGGLVACNDSDGVMGTGTSQVRVMLTDAPSDLIESAVVTISRVYLTGEDGADVDLRSASDEPLTFDLLDLRNGVEAFLADRRVPAAAYGQLRLVVTDAEVTLVDGVIFEDGSSTRELKVPSGAQSGIKVQLPAPIDADEGEVTIVVVDFDVEQNFVVQQNAASPGEVKDVLFTPLLQEKRREESPIP